jgi:hypothetical protein
MVRFPWNFRVFRGSVVRSCFVAIVVGCSSATATNEPPTRSLLFIGNSLTYTNDLPGMLANLVIATGDSVLVAMAAGPNLALIDHTNGATDAVAQIDRGRWSFVLLQQAPTPAGVCRDTLIIAAMRLAPISARRGPGQHSSCRGPRRGPPNPSSSRANPRFSQLAPSAASSCP